MDEQQEREVIEKLLAEADEEGKKKHPGFLARHFSYEHGGRNRLILDVIVGGILPPLMMYFDPGVFRASDPCFGPAPSLAPLAVFAYVAVGMGVPVFLIWMVFRKRLPGSISGLFAGVLAAGSVFATLLGLRMLPMTIVGLFFIIGVLGLTPFAVAYIYGRHARFAWDQARERGIGRAMLIALMVVGGASVIVPPVMAQTQVTAVVEEGVAVVMAGSSATEVDAAAARLQELNGICPRVCEEMLESEVWEAFYRDQDRADDLTAFYNHVTGNPIYLYDCSSV